MTLKFGFYYGQPINLRPIIFKRKSVCVINLLALFSENIDIIDDAKFSFCINLYQTIMRIYFDSSIDDIIPITFEL